MHDYAATLSTMRDAINWLDRREPMLGTERIALWLDARDVQSDLAIVVRDLETDATDALVELTRGSDDDTLDTPLGPVYVGWTQPAERWEGHRLIGALARDVVDPVTGELVRAVPVDVLRDVVAGCASEDLTSSKWRKTGLRAYVDPRKFYDRDDPRPIIRAGVKP